MATAATSLNDQPSGSFAQFSITRHLNSPVPTISAISISSLKADPDHRHSREGGNPESQGSSGCSGPPLARGRRVALWVEEASTLGQCTRSYFCSERI